MQITENSTLQSLSGGKTCADMLIAGMLIAFCRQVISCFL
jgi:hypothetical protein